jgi:predicted acylesterase/phospholipase RssA
VVRASASIPYLLPPIDVACAGNSLLLTDGGVSDGLPVAFAQRPPLSATHLIVSDCRWLSRRPPLTAWLVRHVERFPYVPSDSAARDERCREAYNIQVQGLASHLAGTGIRRQ